LCPSGIPIALLLEPSVVGSVQNRALYESRAEKRCHAEREKSHELMPTFPAQRGTSKQEQKSLDNSLYTVE
jgi:hypothetical protein